MTALIVLGSIAAYLTIGAAYARSQAVAAYRRAKAKWKTPRYLQESVTLQLVWRTLLWPVAIAVDVAIGGVGPWIVAPIGARQAAAQQARDDAKAWREKLRSGTPTEVLMASELARMCEERAAELDL